MMLVTPCVSAASDLIANDTNGIPDVFVRDLQAGTTTLVSIGAKNTNSTPSALATSESPDITPDGHYVAFFSTATNLIPGVGGVGEVYVRDLIAGTGIRDGVANIMTLHTTTAITVNEGLPDLEDDLLELLADLAPPHRYYRHARFLHSDGQMAFDCGIEG